MDHSLPDSSVHGDSPGKSTGMGCHAFLQEYTINWVMNKRPKIYSLSFYLALTLDPHRRTELYTFSVQFSSVTQSCPTLCDPMNRGTPGLPVHHQLLEFTQTHVHRVSDAIQPSHPLSSPSPPAPNPSQH